MEIFMRILTLHVVLTLDSASIHSQKIANHAIILSTKIKNKMGYVVSTIQTSVHANCTLKKAILDHLVYKVTNGNSTCSMHSEIRKKSSYVLFVVKNEHCSYMEQIEYAIKSNASAIIINTYLDKDFDMLNNQIDFENNRFLILYVNKSIGDIIEESIQKALNYKNMLFVSIELKADNAPLLYNFSNLLSSNLLAATSIKFTVLGIVVFVLLISSMLIIFYFAQKFQIIHEKQHLEQLTRQAISKNQKRRLKAGDKELLSNEKCVVCLDGFKVNDSIRCLPCMHFFHKKEIDQWLYINQSCPVCKIDILKAYGLNINIKSSCFQRILERLSIVSSSDEQMIDDGHEYYNTMRIEIQQNLQSSIMFTNY